MRLPEYARRPLPGALLLLSLVAPACGGGGATNHSTDTGRMGGATDAKVLDQQSGAEMLLSLMTALLHGANIVHDLGFMNSGLLSSSHRAASADDMLGFLRAATRGVEVSDETWERSMSWGGKRSRFVSSTIRPANR